MEASLDLSTTDPDGMAVLNARSAAISGRRTTALCLLSAGSVRLVQRHRSIGLRLVERQVRMVGAARILGLLAAEGC